MSHGSESILLESGVGTVLGPRNPKPLEGPEIPLYECSGETFGVAEFAAAHQGLLNQLEASIVARGRDLLLDRSSVPSDLATCLTRSCDIPSSSKPTLHVSRSGARSAYWRERSLKLKGCRPTSDGATFPLEVLPFGARRITHVRVPFGVMRAEGVMREILAYCFLTQNGMPVHSTPVCVWEYRTSGRSLGYCLVLRTKGEERAEQFIDYPACSLGDIVKPLRDKARAPVHGPFGSELRLRGLNLWKYLDQKAECLARLHFAGGARGVLNSNIGNDVLVRNAVGDLDVYLCDFDTFSVMPVPAGPREPFLEAFTLRCLVEVVKGSLSILDYVDLPRDCSPADRGQYLGEVYFQRSSCWRAYKRVFDRNVSQRIWSMAAVDAAFQHARRTEAFANVLSSCVLNSHYLDTMAAQRGIFYPHN